MRVVAGADADGALGRVVAGADADGGLGRVVAAADAAVVNVAAVGVAVVDVAVVGVAAMGVAAVGVAVVGVAVLRIGEASHVAAGPRGTGGAVDACTASAAAAGDHPRVPSPLRPRLAIATPAAVGANNGNRRTAERWAAFLADAVEVRIHGPSQLDGLERADALVALHAVKSRPAIERFRAVRPGAPVAVVLTGTDLYGDGAWRHGAESASVLVVLQPAALRALDGGWRAKARAIVQSAEPPPPAPAEPDAARRAEAAEVVAVGHLRAVKDPHTVWRAARRLAGGDGGRPVRIDHVGAALEPDLADAARATEAACGGAFRWRGALDHAAARRAIAAARVLVHPSLAEGGAHAVIEAIVSGTAVVASRIDGNTGLLGDDHPGLFAAGDDAALAALVRRALDDPAFGAALAARSVALAPRFATATERDAVRALARDLLAAAGR